jgi:hypothetical protein
MIVPFLSLPFPVALALLPKKWLVVMIVGSVLVARVQAVTADHRCLTGL